MSDSLKDQLLALGLVPEKNAPKKKSALRPKKIPQKQDVAANISLDQAYRIRIKEERREKEKAIAEKRELERQRREVNKKIREIVKQCAVNDKSADIKRSFVYKGKIRSVLTTAEQLKHLNEGTLGVVYLSGNYHLMLTDRIEEIRQFAPDHIPDLAGAENEDEKDNPVPDDLVW